MFSPAKPRNRSGAKESMEDQRGHWSSSVGFVLAATGSAIGLGNLWKFPFITWENDGGAFVIVYLMCIAAVGLPIMMADTMVADTVATIASVLGGLFGYAGAECGAGVGELGGGGSAAAHEEAVRVH